MKYLKLFLISTLFISGCASVQEIPPKREEGNFPPINTKTTVYVGQVMVSEYSYIVPNRAIIRDSVAGNALLGRRPIAAGTTLVGVTTGEKKVFCEPPGIQSQPCFKDTNNDGRFDKAYALNAFQALTYESNIPPARYDISSADVQEGFKYELIYQGISGNTIKLSYREFSNNMARPAFHQDLSYNFEGEGTSIRFRNVSMIIHDANNNEVVFTVNSGF